MKPQRLADIDPQRFIQRRQAADPAIEATVRGIWDDVAKGGDQALRALTARLDGIDLESPWLDQEAWEAAARACPADVRLAIDGNLRRIRAFHEMQRGEEQVLDVVPGLRLGRRAVPFNTVACYVPGGRASYPSTVLMTVTPAVIAGVRRIIVVTPPGGDSIDPAVAYAAQAAGATDILLAGGAQAIAACALGTPDVPQVQAIVGPGNAYVTAAKRLASDLVRTDAPAGPSELLVIADADADATAIALDLAAQAEHDPDAQVLLVSTDDALAGAVSEALDAIVAAAPRRAIIEASLAQGALLVADDLAAALAFADAYAPEHLELHVRDPQAVLDKVRNAGSVFLGSDTPVSLGDYGSGTNHVLPTMGQARLRGGLCVDDFRRWMTWQEATRDGLEAVARDVTTLADAEGLTSHAEAVRRRLA